MGWLDDSWAPDEAARHLLGATLRTDLDGVAAVRLTEVEAYGGADDPASHAHRRRTERNASMFGGCGTLYTYRSYGIHVCANVVVGPPGTPGAVLVRAGEIVEGLDLVRRRRGRDDHLADGPGKLCQALGITLAHDGLDLADPDGPVRLVPGPPVETVDATPRVGITKAVDRPWRFVSR